MDTCPLPVTSTEERLREAQATEALNDMRRYLRQRSFASTFKIKNVTGQRANTRARQWINTINGKVVAAKLLYRRARSSLFSIRGPGDWEKVLRILDDADVRAVNERALTAEEKADRLAVQKAGGVVDPVDGVAVQQTASLGDGRRTISWIWHTPGAVDTNDKETRNGMSSGFRGVFVFNADNSLPALHIEWLKARARAARYWENICLVYEEMRRVIVTTCWIASQWENRAKLRTNVSKELGEGLAAYAFEHAALERVMASRWEKKWKVVQEVARRTIADHKESQLRMADDGTYFSNDDAEDIDADDPDPLLPPGFEHAITLELDLEPHD